MDDRGGDRKEVGDVTEIDSWHVLLFEGDKLIFRFMGGEREAERGFREGEIREGGERKGGVVREEEDGVETEIGGETYDPDFLQEINELPRFSSSLRISSPFSHPLSDSLFSLKEEV